MSLDEADDAVALEPADLSQAVGQFLGAGVEQLLNITMVRSNWSAAGLLAVICSAAVASTGAKVEPWSVVWRELSKTGLARGDRGSLCRESARESAYA